MEILPRVGSAGLSSRWHEPRPDCLVLRGHERGHQLGASVCVCVCVPCAWTPECGPEVTVVWDSCLASRMMAAVISR